jgi:hypothetical protein
MTNLNGPRRWVSVRLIDLVPRGHPALDRIGRDRAGEHDDVDSTVVEALSGWRTGVRSTSRTTLTLCYFGAATPSASSVVRGLPTGYEADAELIYVTGREKMQVVDHAVVTAHE